MKMWTVKTKKRVTRKEGISMRTIIAMLVGCYMLLAFSVPMAHAFTDVSANAKGALVNVRGKGADPFAAIFWEGLPVGMAKANGDFKFKAPLPADCTGTLFDGSTTLEVTVNKCTPSEEPPGAPVDRQEPAPLFSPLQPVAFWSFNRCAMDGDLILDGSPSRAHLSLDRVFCVIGKYGLAASFNGVDTIAQTEPGLLNFSDKLTVSAWVYPERLTGLQTIVNKWYAMDSYILLIQDGRFVFAVAFPGDASHPWGVTAYVAAPATAKEWTHLAGVFDGATRTVTLYVNGVYAGSSSTPGSSLQQSNRPVVVGNHPSWNAFQGKIDEVGLYNAAFTEDQVRSLAAADLPPYQGADTNVHPETDEYPAGAEHGFDFYGGHLGHGTYPCQIQDRFFYDVLTWQTVVPPVCQFSYEAASIARPERTYGFWHVKGPNHDDADNYASPFAYGQAQADAFIAQWRKYRHIVGGYTLFADVERSAKGPDTSGWLGDCNTNPQSCDRNVDVLEGFLDRIASNIIDIRPGVYTRPGVWVEFFGEDFFPMNSSGEGISFVLWLTGCGTLDQYDNVRTPEEVAIDLPVVERSVLGRMRAVVWQYHINYPADFDAMRQNPSENFIAIPDPFGEVFVRSCP